MTKLNNRLPLRLWDFAFLCFFAFLGLTEAAAQALTAFGIDPYLNSFVERIPFAVLCTVIAVQVNYRKSVSTHEVSKV